MQNLKIMSSLMTFIQCAALITIAIYITYWVPLPKRGFYCNDPTLSLPRLPDTISNKVIVTWSFMPIFVLLLCELILNHKKYDSTLVCLKSSWRNASYLYRRYLINLTLVHLLLFPVKYITRSHRPHFFESCKPDALLTCTTGEFVGNYTCTNQLLPIHKIADASQSFFSGHAVISFYSCTFIAWYLQKRVQSKNVLWLPLLQTILITLAYFVSISRVFNHRHHAIDVVVGTIIGILTTVHAWLHHCRNFSVDFQDFPSDDKRKIAPMPCKNSIDSTNALSQS